jgi:hypothetical protein
MMRSLDPLAYRLLILSGGTVWPLTAAHRETHQTSAPAGHRPATLRIAWRGGHADL